MKPRLPLHRRSALVPLGQALILAGFLPGFVTDFARNLAEGPVRSALLVATDALRLCFVAGLGLVLVGWMRNRRARAAVAAPRSSGPAL